MILNEKSVPEGYTNVNDLSFNFITELLHALYTCNPVFRHQVPQETVKRNNGLAFLII